MDRSLSLVHVRVCVCVGSRTSRCHEEERAGTLSVGLHNLVVAASRSYPRFTIMEGETSPTKVFLPTSAEEPQNEVSGER